MTVGELTGFLRQFDTEVDIAVFLEGEDRLERMEVFSEPSGEPNYPNYPMIVVAWQ